MRRRKLICLALALVALAGGCKKQSSGTLTDLHRAAGKGDIETVRSLLVSGADANTRDATGKTPLHGAENPDIARLLIGFGADVNAQDKWSRTPLLNALGWRGSETAKLLINRGADVTFANQTGETPLHLAAEYGQAEIVQLLIARGAAVNARTIEGDAPLWRAAKSDDLEVVQLLVAHGAEVDTKGGQDFSTPLHLAAESGSAKLLQFLLSSGARIDPTDNLGRTPAACAMHKDHKHIVETLVASGANVTIHLAAYLGDASRTKTLIENGRPVDQPDTKDHTPLYYAAQQGHTNIARLLIAKGAKVNGQNGGDPLWTAVSNGRYEMTTLLLASGVDIGTRYRRGYELVQQAVERGHNQVARLLIAEGANVSLHLAAQAGHLGKVKEFVAGGADLDASEEEWNIMAPLHWAVDAGHMDIAAFLLASGADPNVRDHSGETPLYKSALYGLKDIAELLISHGADVNAQARAGEDSGQPPLHGAAYGGHPALISLLIENGADVNAQDKYGQSPLHYAAHCGHTPVVSLLLQKGADLGAKDNEERTPLAYAREAGFADIVALLGGHAADPELKRHGPYTEIITDTENVRKFLRCYGIDHDEIWIPESKDIEGLHEVLAAHLRKDSKSTWKVHVLANLRRYNREYTGIVVEGRKYIICAMNLAQDYSDNVPDNRFAEISDGWWSVVRIIFDAEKKEVVHIECNGSA